jgi:hypothetical protein
MVTVTTDKPRYPEQRLPVDQVLWECFRHFAHLDHTNAAMHTAIVRYSPITFRLAEHLAPLLDTGWFFAPQNEALLREVVNHIDAYDEDPGR